MNESYGSGRLLPEDIARRTEELMGVSSIAELWLKREEVVFEAGHEERDDIPYITNTYRTGDGSISPSITFYRVDTANLWGRNVSGEYVETSHRIKGNLDGEEIVLEAVKYKGRGNGRSDGISGEATEIGHRLKTFIIKAGQILLRSDLEREEIKRISRVFRIR